MCLSDVYNPLKYFVYITLLDLVFSFYNYILPIVLLLYFL